MTENKSTTGNVPIIIVGSHRDKLKDKLDIITISSKLEVALKDSPGSANIIECPAGNLINEINENKEFPESSNKWFFFPIDNTANNQKDQMFQQLMITIFKEISNSDYVREKIKFDYFIVLDNIEKQYSQVNIAEKGNLISFISNNTGSKKSLEKSESILDFFIKKGLFLEFNNKIIFHLDNFLINSITKIIFDPRYHHKNIKLKYQWDMELQILFKRGITTYNFISKLLTEPEEQVASDKLVDKDFFLKNTSLVATKDEIRNDKLDSKTSITLDEVDLIVNFMIHHNLIIMIGDSFVDKKCQRFMIPSLLTESKLSHRDILKPSSYFFFRIPNREKNFSISDHCFMSDNCFYELVGKLIELSRSTSLGIDEENFVFKDLIMMRLGAHIIILKSFPETNCIQLHALYEMILLNFIVILTYIIEKMMKIFIHFDVLIDKQIYYSSCNKVNDCNKIVDYPAQMHHPLLVLCPSHNCSSEIFLKIMVFLSNYNISPQVKIYDRKIENIDLKSLELAVILIMKDGDEAHHQFKTWTNNSDLSTVLIYLLEDHWDEIKEKVYY